MWQCIEEAISDATGKSFCIAEKQFISTGGSNASSYADLLDNKQPQLNLSFKISDKKQNFFVKINNKNCFDNFQTEAYSLKQLNAQANIASPTVTAMGTSLDKSFLVLDYINFDKAKPMLWHQLGQQLAQMHYETGHGQFGWQHDNYIGQTLQPNHWSSNWGTFFSEQRIGWQLQLLSERAIFFGNIEHITQVCHDILLHHAVTPCLVHGDLWQGNTGFCQEQAMIFDPACYYGDREVDIAMTELFGHFPVDFYHGYQAEYPLDEGYSQRKLVYNFYHILNHANIFGGIYIDQAKAILSRIMSLPLH